MSSDQFCSLLLAARVSASASDMDPSASHRSAHSNNNNNNTSANEDDHVPAIIFPHLGDDAVDDDPQAQQGSSVAATARHPRSESFYASSIHSILREESPVFTASASNGSLAPPSPSSKRGASLARSKSDSFTQQSATDREFVHARRTSWKGRESNGNSQSNAPPEPQSALSIAEKIQIAFDLSSVEPYEGEFSCWLVRSVLLQGRLFLTQKSICFYAKLPVAQGRTLKAGFLAKKSRTLRQYVKYWFVLRDDNVLSCYGNAKDLYHPMSIIDLKDVQSVEDTPRKENGLLLKSKERSFHLLLDTQQEYLEWKKVLQAAAFRSRNQGNSVKIVLPLANVSGIRLVHTELFDNALLIKVQDEGEVYVDEYCFAHFPSGDKVFRLLQQLREKLDTVPRDMPPSPNSGRIQDSTGSSPWKPPSASSSSSQPSSMAALSPPSSAAPAQHSTSTANSLLEIPSFGEWRLVNWWTSALPSIRFPSKPFAAPWRVHRKQISDILAVNYRFDMDAARKLFPLPETEKTIRLDHRCYLVNGVLPWYGHLLLTENYFCFVSRLGVRTKMMVPLADLEKVRAEEGSFYYCIYLLTKDQNEMWLEFHSAEARNETLAHFAAFQATMWIGERKQDGSTPPHTRSLSVILDEIRHQDDTTPQPASFREHQLSSMPPILTPESSIVIPVVPMHITCLTIGTRGDVQPFIALCKKLKQHGHTCRIATHGEYREWIESHGIEFGFVGGNPADLMKLCVDNGMFSVSFFREAFSNFGEWMQDLLQTAWEACQGTDVLIESPVAMAGFHIAERLRIPYFSAFTMPWTRTRNFPHPFAVTETNLGTAYNWMTWVLMDQALWRGSQWYINNWRRNVLKLAPISDLSAVLEEEKATFLYNFSPSVVNRPPDWRGWVHVCGYWFLDNPDTNWSPSADLLEFLQRTEADDRKIIYIGFGSIIVPDPEELTSLLVKAVYKAGVRAIISKGWSGRSSSSASRERSFPNTRDIFFVSSVPHDWLFPQVDAVVHHGGAGTTSAGLRSGKPTIIKPFFGDQYFWANCITELGVGMGVRKLDMDALAHAMVKVTSDSKIMNRARMVGEQIRSEHGLDTAVQILHRDVEFQRQRWKKKTEQEDMSTEQEGSRGSTSAEKKPRRSILNAFSRLPFFSSSLSPKSASVHSIADIYDEGGGGGRKKDQE